MSVPAKEKSNILNFDIVHVETLLAKKDWGACWEYLSDVVENLTMTAGSAAIQFVLSLQKDMQDEEIKKYITDFGALLGELYLFLLTDDSVALPDKSYYRIIAYHETLHTLFYIYDLDQTDDLIKSILGDGQKKLSGVQQKKIMLLLSLNTSLDFDEVFKHIAPQYKNAAVTSYFGHRKIFRKNVYKNKVRLYDFRKEFEKSSEKIESLLNSAITYFLCSYMNIAEKHSVKENINVAFRKYISDSMRNLKSIKNSAPDRSGFNLNPDLPTILVVVELFSKDHAMYRCFGQRIKSLENNFNVVFAVPQDRARGLEGEYKNFVPFKNVGDMFTIAHNLKPDILYMPSVGMRFFNIVLANMRVAPIQIMGLGHPATTMSEFIDYVISGEVLYDPVAFPKDIFITDGFPGKYIPLVSKEKFFSPPENLTFKDPDKRIIRVAVVGTDVKVSYPFFELLKDIVASSPFEVHVSFMMGVGGIESLYIEKFLKENFEHSTYHGWQRYDEYIETIKNVDIVLNPFPFGHTNTVIDTLMCGKPCVGMLGHEPSSRTEYDVLESVGLDDQFVAQDYEDYKRKFLNIAEKILGGDTHFFDREEVYNRIFANGAEDAPYDYGAVIKWIYDNNLAIKASGKKFFKVFSEV